MADRLNQHLQRALTLPVSEQNEELRREPHPEPISADPDEASNCWRDGPMEMGAQLPSFFCLLKCTALLMGVLSLAFTLPLCLVLSSSGDSSSLSFVAFLSIIRIATSSSLDILAYLALVSFLLVVALLVLLSFKLGAIHRAIDRAKKTPASYALLMRIPPPQLNEEQVCHEIEAWFRKESKFNHRFAELFPQLTQPEEFSEGDSSMVSEHEGIKQLRSRIVEAVQLSYSYEQFLRINEEIAGMGDYLRDDKVELKTAEISALVHLYNKKRNILALLPVNHYCLVLFRQPTYAAYFYERTQANPFSRFFCVEKYSDFEIDEQRVEVVRGILPNEVYWKHLHVSGCELMKRRALGIALWLVVCGAGSGLQYVFISTRLNSILSGLVMNAYVLLVRVVWSRFHSVQPYAYYSQSKKAIVCQLWVLNVAVLTIAPLAISYLVSPSLLSDPNEFISSQTITLLFYLGLSVLEVLITMHFCTSVEEVNKRNSKEDSQIQGLLISFLTVISISFFLSTLYPLAVPLTFLWLLLMYALQRCNVTRLAQSHHGAKLMTSILKYFQRSMLCLLIGLLTVFGFAAAQLNNQWSLPSLIIIPLMAILLILLEIIGSDGLFQLFSCYKTDSPLREELLESYYARVKRNCVMLYQEFNFAYSSELKQASEGFSARIKIYEELNTMSKTLSLSLKQRLFTNANPIINNQRRMQQPEEDANDIYFEYEKKVTMKKANPRVPVPPLFHKEDPVERTPEDEKQVEMMDINDLFSEDDKDAKNMLKKHIKKKIGNNAVKR